MDITRSIALIEQRGSDLEKARLGHILYGRKPEAILIQDLVQPQNEDGGFPYKMAHGNLSSVSTSLTALWLLDELGYLSSPTADKTIGYLLAVQREDGGWDEEAAIKKYDLPPWISPGDLRTRVYLTAYAAYWLAVTGYTEHPSFHKALEFLHNHQDESGKFHGFLHNTWLATSAFLMAGPQQSDIAEKGLQSLANVPLAEWEASQIAWALDCLSRAGLPGSYPFVKKCLSELVNRQRPDGSWSSEDGEDFAVGATIGVLKVLKFYDLVQLLR